MHTAAGYIIPHQTTKAHTTRCGPNQIHPSVLRPNVSATDRFLLWLTPFGISQMEQCSYFLPADIITCKRLLISCAVTPKSLSNYGAGLVRFTHFCDDLK